MLDRPVNHARNSKHIPVVGTYSSPYLTMTNPDVRKSDTGEVVGPGGAETTSISMELDLYIPAVAFPRPRAKNHIRHILRSIFVVPVSTSGVPYVTHCWI